MKSVKRWDRGRKSTLPIVQNRGCINTDCKYHDTPGSIVECGTSGTSGRNQYFRCRACNKRFSETYGTIFSNKKSTPKEIVQVLKALAEGNTIRGSGRIFEVSKDTVISWLRQAGQHCEKVEDVLVGDFNFSHIQLDELWTFIVKKTTLPVVRNKTNLNRNRSK